MYADVGKWVDLFGLRLDIERNIDEEVYKQSSATSDQQISQFLDGGKI